MKSFFDEGSFAGKTAAAAPAAPVPAMPVGPGAFDPDAFLGLSQPEPAAAPGMGESLLRGAAQGITFGFSDELVGGVESLFTSKSYQQARDESRAANESARAANPGAFLAGEVAGGLATAAVPGVGLARGAGLAAKVGSAALGGAAAGAGYSDASDVGGLAKDAIAGGALGAAGGIVFAGLDKGLAKLAASSPDRAAKRVVQEVVGSSNPGPRNKLIGEGGKNTQRIGRMILQDADMLKVYKDPIKLEGVVKNKLAEASEKLAPIYESVDSVSPGIDAAKVWGAVDAAAAGQRGKFRTALADMLQKKADDLSTQIGGSKFLTAQQMRDVVGSFQDDAFAGSFINPTAAKQALRGVSAELRDMLNSHVETVGARANIAEASGIRRLNQRVADLINLQSVVERSATRAQGATKVAPFSLRNAEMLATNPLALLAGSAVSPELAAVAIGGKAAVSGARAADNSLARAVLSGAKPSTGTAGVAAQRAIAGEGAATVARGRSSIADLAAMASQGASETELEREAERAGIDKGAVKRLVAAFSPRPS